MNELERQLTQALSALSEQYKEDMMRLETQNQALSQQVIDLSQQVQTLSNQLQALSPFLNDLAFMLEQISSQKSRRT